MECAEPANGEVDAAARFSRNLHPTSHDAKHAPPLVSAICWIGTHQKAR